MATPAMEKSEGDITEAAILRSLSTLIVFSLHWVKAS